MSTANLSYQSTLASDENKLPLASWLAFGLLIAAIFTVETNFRGAGAEAGTVDLSLLARLAVVGAYGFFGCWYVSRTIGLYFQIATMWVLLFATWALVTIPFSINLPYAVASVVSLFCALLFVPALILQIGKRNFVLTIIVMTVCHLAVAWIVQIAFPQFVFYQLSDTYMEQEGFRLAGMNHPNGIGALAAALLVLIAVAWHHQWLSKRASVALGLFAGLSLIASDSRSAIIGATAAVLIVILPRVNRAIVLGVLLLVLLFGVAWALGMDVDVRRAMSGASRSGDTAEISGLNGRTMLWGLVIEEIKRSPIIGYGYGCQRMIITSLNVSWAKYQAHNQLLQVMLGSGVIGGLLVFCIFYSAAMQWLRNPNPFADAIMMLVFVCGLAHTVAFLTIPDTISLLLIAAIVWRYLPDESHTEDEHLNLGAT